MKYTKRYIDNLKRYVFNAGFADTVQECYFAKTINLNVGTVNIVVYLNYKEKPTLMIQLLCDGESDRWLEIKQAFPDSRWYWFTSLSNLDWVHMYKRQEYINQHGFASFANDHLHKVIAKDRQYCIFHVYKKSISFYSEDYTGHINISFDDLNKEHLNTVLSTTLQWISKYKVSPKKTKTNQKYLESHLKHLSHINRYIEKTDPALAQLNDLFN